MRKITYIFLFIISFYGLNVSAAPVDTLGLVQEETLVVQPVIFNPATQKEFKKDKMFDYYQTTVEKPSVIELLFEWLRNINPNITKKQVNVGFWIGVGLLFLFIVWLVYHYKPSFFYINRKQKIGFQVEDEDIYQLDFEELIKKALASENYPEAIRWKYLQILKSLHENELISWDANKTVNEYVYELKRPDFVANFKALSQQFVYYRYGNGLASDEDYKQFASLSNQIIRKL